MIGARPTDQAGRATHGAAKASPPSGDHPSRGDLLALADGVTSFAKEHPEMFDVKRRAIGAWSRFGFWTVGVMVGCLLQRALTGSAINPTATILGLLFATLFVYFDPPKVRTVYKLRDSDGNGEADETENTGSARKGDSAGPQDIAQ